MNPYKRLPRRLDRIAFEVSSPFSIKRRLYSREKTFHTARRLIDSFNSTSLNSMSHLNDVKKEDMFMYNYDVKVNNSIQIPSHEYNKLVNIISKYGPLQNMNSKRNLKARNSLLSNAVIDYNELKTIRKLIELRMTEEGKKSDKVFQKADEHELRKIFFKEEVNERSSSSNSIREGNKTGEETWKEIRSQNRFSFKIDTVTDLVSVKHCDVLPKKKEQALAKVTRKNVGSTPIVSSFLQRRRFLGRFEREKSITVIYSIKDDWSLRMRKRSTTKSREVPKETLDKFWLRARDKSYKQGSFIKKLIHEKLAVTCFDLNKKRIMVFTLNELVVLYKKVRTALSPSLFGIQPTELELVDSEILNMQLENLDQQENEVITQYKSYIQSETIFKGFWANKQTSSTKPICREGMAIAVQKHIIYLFGGYGNDRLSDLWRCTKTNTQYNWELIRPLGNSIPEGRYGHCMSTYGDYLYIHAGGSEFNSSLNERRAFNDLWRYSVNDNTWTQLNPEIGRNAIVPRRIGPASCVLGQLWMIHGGALSEPNKLCGEMTSFDLEKNRFVELVYHNTRKKIPPLVGHSMVSVMPTFLTQRVENRAYWVNFHIWKFSENDILSPLKIGVYVLGGINEKGMYNQSIWRIKCSSMKARSLMQLIGNDLTGVKMKFVAEIEKVKVSGIPPKPRSNQAAIFIQKYIAVFGGKNNQRFYEPNSYCLNDICLLDLQRNEWIPLVVYGFAPTPRWCAAMLPEDDKILVFGGVTDNRFCSFNIYSFETSKETIRKHLDRCREIKKQIETEFKLKKFFKMI